tara:strand:+ start:71 stop:406 length:336 start_codon:yes stop_codon:yes gene_type:complete
MTVPTTYTLKKPVLDYNRLQKACKQVLDDAKEDRKHALDMHRFFRELVDENPQDAVAKNLMVDCLKLAQSSKANVHRTLDLLIKLENTFSKGEANGSSENLFDKLSTILHD